MHKAAFTQNAENAALRCAMKPIHFNGLRRARAVRCCAERSARAAERTSGELARTPWSKFKIVQILPLRAVTFPRAANRDGASKQAYKTPAKIFEYFALASVAQIALYLKGCAEPSGRRSACRVLCESRLTCDSRELKNLNFGGYSRRVNQSGACSSSDVITT